MIIHVTLLRILDLLYYSLFLLQHALKLNLLHDIIEVLKIKAIIFGITDTASFHRICITEIAHCVLTHTNFVSETNRFAS